MILFFVWLVIVLFLRLFFFQAEDGIRDLVRSRGLGDVYKRQDIYFPYYVFYHTNRINFIYFNFTNKKYQRKWHIRLKLM
mgnify:CR=1 FL=1